jgi:uncharacterized membrane protein (DUF485 family)
MSCMALSVTFSHPPITHSFSMHVVGAQMHEQVINSGVILGVEHQFSTYVFSGSHVSYVVPHI